MFESSLLMAKKKSSKNLLMHFDGENNSTLFKDEGGRAFSKVGEPRISTDQYMFGGSSGYFDIDGLNIQSPLEIEGDFTIDAWIYVLAYPATRAGITGSSQANSRTSMMFAANGRLGYWMPGTGNSGSTFASSGNIPLNTWWHVAASRENSTYRLFSNGIRVFERVDAIKPIVHVDKLMIYNVDTNTDGFKGYVDELFIDVGVARYINNFTPPTSPFVL